MHVSQKHCFSLVFHFHVTFVQFFIDQAENLGKVQFYKNLQNCIAGKKITQKSGIGGYKWPKLQKF